MDNEIRRRAGVLAVALLVTGLLAACGEGAAEVGDEPTPASTTVTSQTGPSVEQTSSDASDANAALDAYVELERATIPQILEMNAGIFDSVTIDPVYPSGITYEYTYVEPLDPDVAYDYFETTTDTIQQILDTAVFPAMASQGVEGPYTATYTYINPDGTVLWTKTLTGS